MTDHIRLIVLVLVYATLSLVTLVCAAMGASSLVGRPFVDGSGWFAWWFAFAFFGAIVGVALFFVFCVVAYLLFRNR